jgi:hypothetical protein
MGNATYRQARLSGIGKRLSGIGKRLSGIGKCVIGRLLPTVAHHGRWPASARWHFAETLSRFISRQSWYALSGDPSASLEQNLRTS